MKQYTVVWQASCENEVAEYWVTMPDPMQITRAANQIDSLLRLDPHEHGDDLHEGLCTITVPPLKAVFSVSEEKRVVEVWRIRLLES